MTGFFDLSMTLVLIAMTGSVVLLVMTFLDTLPGRAARLFAVAVVATVVLQSAPGLAMDGGGDSGHRENDRPVHFATSSGLHFYAGGDVDVTGSAEDLFVAGGEVKVDSAVSAAMTVVGGDVSVRDMITDRAVISGGNVEISGTINKHLIAAGGRVDVENDTQVLGDVVIAGGRVSFDGDVVGDFIAVGGDVELSGSVGGNANIRSPNIDIADGTTIAGNLTYSSPTELRLDPSVSVAGSTIREEWRGDRESFFEDMGLGKIIAFAVTALLATLAALFVFSAVVMAVFSRHFDKANGVANAQPLQSFGLGVLVAVMLPTAAVILLVTIIGIPLGLFAMAAFAVLLGLGLVVAAYWIGLKVRGAIKSSVETPRMWGRLGWMFAGLVLFSLIGLIPILGNLVQFLAVVTGAGAFILAASGSGEKPSEAASL